MLDFEKLNAAKTQPKAIDPLDIFRRLPKPIGINDLYTSQAEVLKQWFERRKEIEFGYKTSYRWRKISCWPIDCSISYE